MTITRSLFKKRKACIFKFKDCQFHHIIVGEKIQSCSPLRKNETGDITKIYFSSDFRCPHRQTSNRIRIGIYGNSNNCQFMMQTGGFCN